MGYYFSIRLTVGKQSIKPKKANFKGIVSTNTWPRILLENLEKKRLTFTAITFWKKMKTANNEPNSKFKNANKKRKPMQQSIPSFFFVFLLLTVYSHYGIWTPLVYLLKNLTYIEDRCPYSIYHSSTKKIRSFAWKIENRPTCGDFE